MKLKLRGKFLLPAITLVVIGMGITAFVSYRYATGALKGSVSEGIKIISMSSIRTVEEWLAERNGDIRDWSKNKAFITAFKEGFIGKSARKAAGKYLEDLQKEYPVYESLNLTDKNGEVIASSLSGNIGEKLSDQKYFQESIAGKAFQSDVKHSPTTNNPIFVFSNPI